MKRFLLLALCAILSANADARTLYVNASRPNNSGNGLSAKKAKKTLQAAINIANAGDTILVYPGSYAPIQTNNKKITIKSTKGSGKTSIAKSSKKTETVALASLGKSSTYVGTLWKYQNGQWSSDWKHPKTLKKIDTSGTATQLSGFSLDGKNRPSVLLVGVSGGTVKACTISRLTQMWTASGPFQPFQATACVNANLTQCVIRQNQCLGSDWGLVSNSSLQRCRIQDNECGFDGGTGWSFSSISGSRLYNCLLTGNQSGFSFFEKSTLLNCTIADNSMVHQTSGAKFSKKSKFFDCILRNNRSRREWSEWVEVEKTTTEIGYYDEWDDWNEGEPEVGAGGYDDDGNWVEYVKTSREVVDTDWVKELRSGRTVVHNVDSGNDYKNTDKTNKDPKFASSYKLKKGSYCINSGKLTKAQKKLVGTKDLAGRKRIKGKAVDRGCYEY